MSQMTVEDANTWHLSGELTFATVSALFAELHQRAQQTWPQTIDLRDVTHTDSAGLALLIELRRQTQNSPLVFRNLPTQMMTLANVHSVQALLI
ncbi:MAG: hypothetical protein BWK79_16245 [Beggiatoa sp. IS2]|nr:MAG: hypothetical protein BWK79_16245 [Beggiatoa sp. IS2]